MVNYSNSRSNVEKRIRDLLGGSNNMKTSAIAALSAAAWLGVSGIAAASPVTTDSGLVEGTSEDGIAVYRGIPFAAPPVGDLRWRAPQPPAKWPGVLKADKFAQLCMQPPTRGTPASAVSENCLYLNVWSPAKSPADKLPVMVYIYGGGFIMGTATEPLIQGDRLATKGVIVVTLAYRVGPMGFFAHPALSAESPRKVSGNYGLLDQIAGLQWVQKNIAAFGGDPKRVTIFGESAGGISVSMLAVSPLAKGLFAGVISESGGSFGPPRTQPEPGENMRLLAAAEQDGARIAQSMNARSAADLRKASPDDFFKAGAGMLNAAWPVIDGWVILDDQYKLYTAGKYNSTPVLIGTNSNEGAIFGAVGSPESYAAAVRKRFGPHADAVLSVYPADAQNWAQSSHDIMRDAGFAWHTWVWADLQVKAEAAQAGNKGSKSKAFVYYFDHQPPRAEGSRFKNAVGAVHTEEMIYVFDHLDQAKLPWTDADRALAQTMSTYWTNFAKHGDPNGPGVPEWPAYDSTTLATMHFEDAPQVAPVANLAKLKVLDAYFAWRRTPEGAQFGAREPTQ
jgi:para-nitrobenzyl esterase